MREIKFRAWDIDHKAFAYFDFADLDVMVAFWGDSGLVEFTDFGGRYQQYTGLKDKNGKEIYEGDITRVWWEEDPKEIEIHPIEFKDGAFEIEMTGGDFDHWIVGTNNLVLEVIGNIHENGDLLK